jgi:hypothetical protein
VKGGQKISRIGNKEGGGDIEEGRRKRKNAYESEGE